MHQCQHHRFLNTDNLKGIWFHIAGIACLIWFLFRVAPAPHRSQYPCQQIAIPVALSYIAFWSCIWFGLRIWLKKTQSRTSTIAPAVIEVLMILISLTGVSFATTSLPTSYDPWGPIPKEPMGIPQGVNPGRVVWVWNPDASEKDLSGYWWLKENNNQEVIDGMVTDGIQQLIGVNDTYDAWDQIFRYFNQEHGYGDIGYSTGEKIAIKINLNNCYDSTDPYVKEDNERDASPYLVKALLKHLVSVVGVVQDDITVYDASRKMGNWIYNRIYYEEYPADLLVPEFPDIHYVDKAGGALGREQVQPSSELIYFADGLTRTLPTSVVEADYLINMPILKMHPINHGVTLSGKNMFGTWIEPVVNVHNYHIDGLTLGNPTPQTDLFAHEHIGAKTLLFLGDGIYSTLADHCTLAKYTMYPFNNDWTNSLFFSQDPVAIDSVMYDFLYTEGAYPIEGSQNYLHQSAEPPTNTYDPENDGIYLSASLGVHEHWNINESIFSPDRYIGPISNGIEYVPIGIEHAEAAIVITTPKEQYLYFMGEQRRPLQIPLTLIIGSIEVEVIVNGLDQPVKNVEFYLDDTLKCNDLEAPFSWQWNTLSFWRHILTVKGYTEDRTVLTSQQLVWKFL